MAKRKLAISLITIAFVLISVVATVAIVFSLTQQTIKTNLNINYTARDVNATTSSKMVYADGTEQELGVIKFDADSGNQSNTLSPAGDITLTKSNNYIVFEYLFQNTGSKDFIAMIDYSDTDALDKNMIFTYQEDSLAETNTARALLVASGQTKTYKVKIAVEYLEKNASLSGEFNWVLDSNVKVLTNESDVRILFQSQNSNANVVLKDEVVVFDGTFDGSGYNSGSSITTFFGAAENVTFAGTSKTVFSRNFGINPDENDEYLRNVKFYGLNLINGKILTVVPANEVEISDIIISNCSFMSSNSQASEPAIDFDNSYSNVTVDQKIYNITLKNSIINGYYQGIYGTGFNGEVVIENNKFISITHNAIAIQSYSSSSNNETYCLAGNYKILNNKFKNVTNRAIRFGVVKNFLINVLENEFVNVGDEDGQLLKVQALCGAMSLQFSNNILNGTMLADEINDTYVYAGQSWIK